jgi:putative radical SAM enzyme (TIGR03279 family)
VKGIIEKMQECKDIMIKDVVLGSAAHEAGIEKGDKLVLINNKPVNDIFDYRYLISDELVEVIIEKESGEVWELEIEKDINEDLGMVFEQPLLDSPKACKNKCLFCFMDQLAPGMRKTLHFKDDDYRLSFLEGNYITMTNVSEEELDRIIFYKLSPINISVHTTNGELRKKMLNNPNADMINTYLSRLFEAGLDMNFQIVLCKGINDGIELQKTITDLVKFHPKVRSISIVPLGLTKYRDRLYPLEGFDRKSSVEVIEQVSNMQKEFKKILGSNLVYLADEFYINACMDIPSYKHYEGFPQLENGIGMIALFKYQFNNYLKRLKYKLNSERSVSIVTGISSEKYIKDMVQELKNKYEQLEVNLYPIDNNFFGSKITVTGLLTGKDIIAQLKGKELGHELLIPSVMLKSDQDIFLDDVSMDQLEKELEVKVKKVYNHGREFIKAVLGIG